MRLKRPHTLWQGEKIFREKAMEKTIAKAKKKLYLYLFWNHRGREKAICTKDLKRCVHIKREAIRRLVHLLRQDGVPICSCCQGYFYPDPYSDVIDNVSRFYKYGATLSATEDNLLRASVKM